jgi:hypothetical protein
LNTPGGNVVHTHVQDSGSSPSLLPTPGSAGGH